MSSVQNDYGETMQHRLAIEGVTARSSSRRTSLIRRREASEVVRAAAFVAPSVPGGDVAGCAGAARFASVGRSRAGGGGLDCDRSRRRSRPARSAVRTGLRRDHGRTVRAATRASLGTCDRVEARPRSACAREAHRGTPVAPREGPAVGAGAGPSGRLSAPTASAPRGLVRPGEPRGRVGSPKASAAGPAGRVRSPWRPTGQGEKAASSERGGNAIGASAPSRSSASWTS